MQKTCTFYCCLCSRVNLLLLSYHTSFFPLSLHPSPTCLLLVTRAQDGVKPKAVIAWGRGVEVGGGVSEHYWIKMILWSLESGQTFSCQLAPETKLCHENRIEHSCLEDILISFSRGRVKLRSFMLIKQLRQSKTICFSISVYMRSGPKVRKIFI